MDIIKIQLDIAIKIYKYIKSAGTENIIIAPCSIVSSLCALGKLTDHSTADKIYDILNIECQNIDLYIKKINDSMNSSDIDYFGKLGLKNICINQRTKNVLYNCYKTCTVDETDGCSIKFKNVLDFEALWNRPFTAPTEEQIRKRHNSVEIVSILVDAKRRLHMLRRLDNLGCSVVRTSLASNRYILTTISPNEDKEEIFDLLENSINVDNLLDWIDNSKMKKAQHRFKIPKIKMSSSYDMVELLKSLGLNLMETKFSNVFPETTLFVERIVQSSIMEIKAESISLNTDTEIEFTNNEYTKINSSSCSETVVGKPFIFILQCRITGNCIYFGVLRDSF